MAEQFPMYQFTFAAIPKCMVTDRPTASDIDFVTKTNRMLFVIVPDLPISQEKTLDLFIDGFLAGCGVSRSERMTIFFNDTDRKYDVIEEEFINKYKKMSFPESISGYTTVATGKKGNMLSSFLPKKAATLFIPDIVEEKKPNELF